MDALPVTVERLGHIDSTNAEARRRADAGRLGPVWLMADSQDAGRGRDGRPWASPSGNLYTTLLTPFQRPPAEAALMSFAACLAVAAVLDEATADPARTTLKWPNDALLDGRKVAGVLLEAGAGWLAVGVGINLATRPADADTRWPPISLHEAGATMTPEAAVTALARHFHLNAARLRTEGFAPLRREWLARAARLNEVIEARTPSESITGRFTGLAVDGALMLETSRGPRRLAAADVHFPEI